MEKIKELLKKYWWVLLLAVIAMVGFKKRKTIKRKSKNVRKRYKTWRSNRRMKKKRY